MTFALFAPLESLPQAKPRYPRLRYVVRPGDTLEAIARRYKMKVMEVRAINDLWRGDVRAGQEIHVQRKRRAHSLEYGMPRSEPLKALQKPSVLSFSFSISLPGDDLDSINEQTPLTQEYDGKAKQGDRNEVSRHKRQQFRLRSRSAHVPTAVDELCRVFDMPTLIGAKPEDILSEKRYGPTLMPKIISYLPYFCRAYDWELLFSNTQHGSSLHTLLRRMSKMKPTLILAETSSGEVFGGFNTTPWTPAMVYSGNGEAFVLSCVPHFAVYDWKRTNTMFMIATETGIAMGGGGHFAWHIDGDLSHGTSGQSETFGNPCLTSQESFELACIEAWGFSLRW